MVNNSRVVVFNGRRKNLTSGLCFYFSLPELSETMQDKVLQLLPLPQCPGMNYITIYTLQCNSVIYIMCADV